MSPAAFVSCSLDQSVKVWSTDGHLMLTLKGHTDAVNSACFSPDGKKILSASCDSTLKMWNSEDGDLLQTFSGHHAPVSWGCFSPDGLQILSSSQDGDLCVWDVCDSSCIRQIYARLCKGLNHSSFSKDGKFILTASEDCALYIWKVMSGDVFRVLIGHTRSVYSGNFSPQGLYVVSASGDCTLKLWHSSTGTVKHTLRGHQNIVTHAIFTADGDYVYSTSYDKTVKIWCSSTGNLERTLTCHNQEICCGRISDNGNWFITSSIDKSSKVWRMFDGELLYTLVGHKRGVTCCNFDNCSLSVSNHIDQYMSMRVDIDKQHRENLWLHAAALPRVSPSSALRIVDVPSRSPFAQLLRNLIINSVVCHRRSWRSCSFCVPPKLSVLNVRFIVNPSLQSYYMVKLQQMEKKYWNAKCSPIAALLHLKLPSSSIDIDLNEHILFHGAQADTIPKICQDGLNPQRGGENTGKLFGVASYYAINSSKSDAYTEDRHKPLHPNAVRTIIVARAALGESFCALRPMPKAKRPPDNSWGSEFDSVWADTRLNHGCVDHVEVMVYNEAQSLPIALVDYVHETDCSCALCQYRS